MNVQPYGTPPRWWPPKMALWWVRLSRGYRWRQLRRQQKLARINLENGERLRGAVDDGLGVLITPNHSAHYDSAALYLAGDQIDVPLYFLTAWQVFAMSSRFEVWAMQRLGAFSIDREGSDRRAFKQAVEVLRGEPHPLVVFPEGDVYHTTDRVTPFREGAAAIALSAAKRADRKVVALPTAIKFWYLEDPTENMLEVLREIEDRLYLRATNNLDLAARIRRVAEAALALKELDYLGYTCEGRLRDRVRNLLEVILVQLETRHELRAGSSLPPERAKAVRQCLIGKIENHDDPPNQNGEFQELCAQMGDVFFVMQLFSYPGDYLIDNPSMERLAETLDKFEEDILQRDLPSVRARREVQIRIGEPIEIPAERKGRGDVAALTETLREGVQAIIDEINASRESTARGW